MISPWSFEVTVAQFAEGGRIGFQLGGYSIAQGGQRGAWTFGRDDALPFGIAFNSGRMEGKASARRSRASGGNARIAASISATVFMLLCHDFRAAQTGRFGESLH